MSVTVIPVFVWFMFSINCNCFALCSVTSLVPRPRGNEALLLHMFHPPLCQGKRSTM